MLCDAKFVTRDSDNFNVIDRHTKEVICTITKKQMRNIMYANTMAHKEMAFMAVIMNATVRA